MSADARFVGDGLRDDAGTVTLPDPPDGWGGIACLYWFTSTVDVVRGGRVVDDRPNYDTWVPRPVVRVDGREVPASWSGWWYPLRPGPHQVEVLDPAAASLRVDVTAGGTHRLRYRADIHIRRDPAGTVLEWRSTATLDALG